MDEEIKGRAFTGGTWENVLRRSVASWRVISLK
jgi:hypothetical protein